MGISAYITTDPERALSISNALFNGTLANLRAANDFFIYNRTSPNQTSWMAIAGFKNQDNCNAVIAKYNEELRIHIGGNKIIGLLGN